MSWTKERVKLLKEMWGNATAQQIADKLGNVTRNAVIGKANRLKLSRLNELNEKTKLKKPLNDKKQASGSEKTKNASASSASVNNRRAKINEQVNLLGTTAAQMRSAVIADKDEVEPESLNLDLLELTDSTCKWPTSDPGLVECSFCGAQTISGGSYCSYHAAKAYNSSKARARKTA